MSMRSFHDWFNDDFVRTENYDDGTATSGIEVLMEAMSNDLRCRDIQTFMEDSWAAARVLPKDHFVISSETVHQTILSVLAAINYPFAPSDRTSGEHVDLAALVTEELRKRSI